MLGRDLLIAPVRREGRTDRHVLLPDDTWIEVSTGKEYGKGEYLIQAPVGQIPVFVRKNHSVIDEETIAALREEMKS